ncbi:hypothetical protein ACJMK2_016692 [Sinanodonta woodiana]|uniref:Dystroglycan 1 n=1 Tax=Sinanodonta woodiana TaxID=1069815 RepID=A0ABD3UVS7_SINWO
MLKNEIEVKASDLMDTLVTGIPKRMGSFYLYCFTLLTLNIILTPALGQDLRFQRFGIHQTENKDELATEPVTLMWGIADSVATAGHLFVYPVPSDAFSGHVVQFKVMEAGKDQLPSWLTFDEKKAEFRGIPAISDIGEIYLEVVAVGKDGSSAKDVFSVTVLSEANSGSTATMTKPKTQNGPTVVTCRLEEPHTVVTVIVDADLDVLPATEKLSLLDRLVEHLSLAHEIVSMLPVGDKPMFDSSAIVQGHGDVKVPKTAGLLISWLVGCGKVESDHLPILQKLEASASKGAMAQALGHSVIGYHVTNNQFKEKARKRRQAPKITATPTLTMAPPTQLPTETLTVLDSVTYTDMLTRPIPTMASPFMTVQPSRTTVVQPDKTIDMSATIAPSESLKISTSTRDMMKPLMTTTSILPSKTFTMISKATTSTMVMPTSTIITMSTTTTTVLTTKPTTESTSRTTAKVTTQTPTPMVTTQAPTPKPTSKEPTTKQTTTKEPTARPTPPPPCSVPTNPTVDEYIQPLTFQAGEVIRYKIPRNAFKDCDGDAHSLDLEVTMDEEELPSNFWLQYDSSKHQLKGLALDKDVGQYEFELIARNSKDLETSQPFMIIIQGADTQKGEMNHEIFLKFDDDYDEFMMDVNNKITLVGKISRFYGDKNTKLMTVTKINKGSIEFSFMNNSLSWDSCPAEAVTNLASKVIMDNGSLSQEAVNEMKPFNLQAAAVIPHGNCVNHPHFPKRDTRTRPVSKSTAAPVVTYRMPPKTSPEQPTQSTTVQIAAAGAGGGDGDIWITTVLPAVVVVIVLIIALIIACVLYRKKRKGKMKLDEKNTYNNKGVPVIFADELDDKPNDSTRPLIMDEEKPPMPPPEYQRASSESSQSTQPMDDKNHMHHEDIELEDTDVTSPLYQPPPPVTASGNNKPPPPHLQPSKYPPPYVPP